MKIAIAAESEQNDSKVFYHAARAPFFLVYDQETKTLECLSNPAVRGGRAGFVATEFLAQQKVGRVYAGLFGPNFSQALKEAQIDMAVSTATVGEVLAQFRD